MDTGKLTRNILIGMIAGGAIAVMLHNLELHCLLYTSTRPRDRTRYRMPSSA